METLAFSLSTTMLKSIFSLLAVLRLILALPQSSQNGSQYFNASSYQNPSRYFNTSSLVNGSYYLPTFDSNPAKRTTEIQSNQAGYLYGPSLMGNSSFFLTGTLGDQLVANEVDQWHQDYTPVILTIENEAGPVEETILTVMIFL